LPKALRNFDLQQLQHFTISAEGFNEAPWRRINIKRVQSCTSSSKNNQELPTDGSDTVFSFICSSLGYNMLTSQFSVLSFPFHQHA